MTYCTGLVRGVCVCVCNEWPFLWTKKKKILLINISFPQKINDIFMFINATPKHSVTKENF